MCMLLVDKPLVTMFSFWNWLKSLLQGTKPLPPEHQRAQALIAAIDAGGVPLNPARVNAIARELGLEVSRKASVDDTLARIRVALKYQRR